MKEQGSLFDKQSLKGTMRQSMPIEDPRADMTVQATLPAYHAYLSASSRSQYTPDDYTADLRKFGQYVANRALSDVQKGDIQDWIGTLKDKWPPKTVSRKVAAITNYFRWLEAGKVLIKNPAAGIKAARVRAPLPDILFENECRQLLATASSDPRTYLLILLLLETGIKKSELMELRVANFDFSNKYQPELWIKHTDERSLNDRHLKLPSHFLEVFNDYKSQHGVTDLVFPYSQRFVSTLIAEAGKNAKITKEVSATTLRDMFVVRSVKQGERLEDVLEKLGLARTSFDDAKKKYLQLTSDAL
jgi:site-specific recombinase XerD